MIEMYFHGTRTIENRRFILSDGFKQGGEGRFGSGIYLAKKIELALDYGDFLVGCLIDSSDLLKVSYLEIPQLLEENSILKYKNVDDLLDEAEGFPAFKEWILSHGYRGCEIEYRPHDVEVVLYDEQLIRSNLPIQYELVRKKDSKKVAMPRVDSEGHELEVRWNVELSTEKL